MRISEYADAPAGANGRGVMRAGLGEPTTDRDSTAVSLECLKAKGKRLPPFGHELIDAQARGEAVNVYVFAGPGAWDRARARRMAHGAGHTLVLPPNEDPAGFRWPRVPGGLLVDARGLDRQAALRLAQIIVSAGTPLAFVVGDGFGFPVMSAEWFGIKLAPRRGTP